MQTKQSVLHLAASRGYANHGWLNSYHSFSFANYYNPERMHFGVLRVLNDDLVSPSMGFGTHPHDNMEIISIPLSGALKHHDSMNNTGIINTGDVQVMSAGTGIFHSEYNNSQEVPVAFLQIWLLPNQKNVTPRYDQITLSPKKLDNHFAQILSPNPDDDGVWVHQNAWFHLGNLKKEYTSVYHLRDKSNGIYIFVIDGQIEIDHQILNKRDGYGVWHTSSIDIKSLTASQVLLMEVPMHL